MPNITRIEHQFFDIISVVYFFMFVFFEEVIEILLSVFQFYLGRRWERLFFVCIQSTVYFKGSKGVLKYDLEKG